MRILQFAALAAMLSAPLAAQDSADPQAPDLEMWRLDCGTIELSDTALFSDAHLYDGEARTMTVGCYLIRNSDQYLLWDAGLSTGLIGTSLTQGPFTLSMEQSILDQLGELGVSASQVTHAGVSHYHFDHVGQLADFPSAKLLIGSPDWDVIQTTTEGNDLIDTAPFAPWLSDDAAPVVPVVQDHDVFGDGSVQMKAMPGHTPGHRALLVRLPEKGDVLLTGDLYHFEEQIANRGVPQFNTDRADTLASFERFNAIAKALDATVVIQHDPRHLDRLPAFPESAK